MNILTVCIPVYNESSFIDDLITSVINSSPVEKEVVLIDGGSTDDTIEKIKIWQEKGHNIRIINNDLKYVSHGFNLAYKSTQSKYIALIGAHAEYPGNYFETGLALLEKGEADAVGGSLNQEGKTEKGEIIAACMSSKFGVGDTEFRTSKKRGFVQSVAMAIYKRSVFEDIGLFDEELIRNQDDEFHYRMNARGYKILMEPDMESTYYVRDDLGSLWAQYFYYGLFKPMVFKKVKSGLKRRHLIPSIFTGYLLLMPFLLFLTWLAVLPLVAYILMAFWFSIKISKKPKQLLWALISFFVLHLSYGSGMLLGLRKILK